MKNVQQEVERFKEGRTCLLSQQNLMIKLTILTNKSNSLRTDR